MTDKLFADPVLQSSRRSGVNLIQSIRKRQFLTCLFLLGTV